MSSVREDNNALCYIWLTFILLLLAVVCFIVGTNHEVAIYVGVVFTIFSAIMGIMYAGRRCGKKSSDSGGDCCENYCGCCEVCCACCYYNKCWRNCVRTLLCLPPKETRQTSRRLSLTRRDRRRLSAANDVVMNHLGFQLEYVNQSVVTNSQNPGYVMQTSQRTSVTTKLRRFEEQIQTLYREYSYLQTDAEIANSLVLDYSRLEFEQSRLTRWLEGQNFPLQSDLKDMKQSLKKISASFRMARTRMSQDDSVRPDMTINIPTGTHTNTFPSDHMNIYTVGVTGLPEYQEEDPNKSSTNTSQISDRDKSYLRQLNISANDSSTYSRTSINTLPMSNTTSLQNVRLEQLTNPLGGSVYSLAPPADETGAPPTYEEATSSRV